MNPDAGYASMTTRLKQHQRRRESPAALVSFDVSELVPERPLPDWVRHRVKGAGLGRKAAALPRGRFRAGEGKKLDSSSTKHGLMLLDLNNMRKDWKSSSTKRLEAVRRARILKNRQPEAVRGFRGNVRPSGTLSDSPVALFAQTTNIEETEDIFGSGAECGATEMGLELKEGAEGGGKQERNTQLLKDKSYLTLDQSKLPLEVSLRYHVPRCCRLQL